jgi:hypothetical protein
MAIDTDYSFLNLPRAGSSVRGPIARPSFDPTDFSFNLDRYAPSNLPDVEMVAPSLPSLSADESEAVLDNARPFEDIRTLGATFGQKLAETERFFGERVSSLQGNIDDLLNTKSDLTKQLEAAFLQQDEMSQQAIEEQIAALDAQRAELVAQLEQSVAEAEANGVDAVAAAEQVAAEKIATLDQQIAQTAQELQEALAQQDVIRAEESEKRLLELENQKVTLTDQFTQQQTALQEQFGQREAELTGTIDTLQGEINNITGARDSAIAERDQAISQQDTIRAESAEAQAQALNAQANDYQAQLDEMTGQSSQYQTQLGERDQTIADLQAQIAALQGAGQPPADTPPTDPPPPPPPFIKPPIEDPITRPPIMCFVAGTKVDMADGTKKVIENIAVGDKVLALDNETDVVSYVHDIPEADRNLWTINDRITATDSHAFLTKDGWKSNNPKLSNTVYNDYGIDVKTLKVGDKLITNDGVEKVTKLESEKDFVKVYNFTTSNTHTYLVDGVVSHNKMARPPIGRPPEDRPPIMYPGGTPGFYEDEFDRNGRRIKSPDSRAPMPGGIGGFIGKDMGRRDYKLR